MQNTSCTIPGTGYDVIYVYVTVRVSLSTWRGLRLGMPDVEAPVATIAAIEDEVIVMNALVRLLLHVRFVLGRPVKLAAEIRHTLDVDEFIVDALFVSDVCIRNL